MNKRLIEIINEPNIWTLSLWKISKKGHFDIILHIWKISEIGNRVFVQNQSGPHPNNWDKSGVVVECKNFDQYLVKIDGRGRVTSRNRRFLRHYTLPSLKQQWTPMVSTEGPLGSTPVGLISDVPNILGPYRILTNLLHLSPIKRILTHLEDLAWSWSSHSLVIPCLNPWIQQPTHLMLMSWWSLNESTDITLDMDRTIPVPSTKKIRRPPKNDVPEDGHWIT